MFVVVRNNKYLTNKTFPNPKQFRFRELDPVFDTYMTDNRYQALEKAKDINASWNTNTVGIRELSLDEELEYSVQKLRGVDEKTATLKGLFADFQDSVEYLTAGVRKTTYNIQI